MLVMNQNSIKNFILAIVLINLVVIIGQVNKAYCGVPKVA